MCSSDLQVPYFMKSLTVGITFSSFFLSGTVWLVLSIPFKTDSLSYKWVTPSHHMTADDTVQLVASYNEKADKISCIKFDGFVLIS